ncbi:MAG: hypothetical protein AAFQ89_19365 [Cyanobacteria bacterium J06626_18]
MSIQPSPSKGQANLQLALWNKQAKATSDDLLYIRLQKLGLPEEIVSRLHDLLTKVQNVAGKVIRIGKIVLMKILDFVEENFFLVAGVGIGAILSAAIFGLMTSIPMIGPLLTPIAKFLGITITVAGTVAGHSLDQVLPEVGQSLRQIAEKFFQLLVNVLNAIFSLDNPDYTFAAS